MSTQNIKVKQPQFKKTDYCEPRVIGATKIYLHLSKPYVMIEQDGGMKRVTLSEALSSLRRMRKSDFPNKIKYDHAVKVLQTSVELLKLQKSSEPIMPVALLGATVVGLDAITSIGDILLAVVIFLYFGLTVLFLLYLITRRWQ